MIGVKRSVGVLLLGLGLMLQSCGVYTMRDVSIPPEVKTVKVNLIENKARYINPQLAPRLTDQLQQRIVNQTKLTRTSEDNAHWVISATITDYGVSTSGISNSQASVQQLGVALQITVRDNTVEPAKTNEYSVVKSYEFPASLTLQQAEARLGEDIVKGLIDEIFNRVFSNW